MDTLWHQSLSIKKCSLPWGALLAYNCEGNIQKISINHVIHVSESGLISAKRIVPEITYNIESSRIQISNGSPIGKSACDWKAELTEIVITDSRKGDVICIESGEQSQPGAVFIRYTGWRWITVWEASPFRLLLKEDSQKIASGWSLRAFYHEARLRYVVENAAHRFIEIREGRWPLNSFPMTRSDLLDFIGHLQVSRFVSQSAQIVYGVVNNRDDLIAQQKKSLGDLQDAGMEFADAVYASRRYKGKDPEGSGKVPTVADARRTFERKALGKIRIESGPAKGKCVEAMCKHRWLEGNPTDKGFPIEFGLFKCAGFPEASFILPCDEDPKCPDPHKGKGTVLFADS